MSSGSIHSTDSKETGLTPTVGSHKIKYQAHCDWDFSLDVINEPIDLSLVLPHYRARNQPVNHRLNMFVGQETGSVKLKVCRNFPRTKFCLEVQASNSDVTIWLPSDFKGQICHTGKASFSAGFANRIMQNVTINQRTHHDPVNEDGVTVVSHGRIMFRMWDVQTGLPENTQKEKLKRMFGSSRKAVSPEPVLNWDFLLDD